VKISHLFGLVLCTIVIISLAVLWFVPSNQIFMTSNAVWNGARDFVDKSKVQDINTYADLPGELQQSALISIPYIEYSATDLSALQQYIENGGTLILMDSFGYGNRLLEYLNIAARFRNTILLDPLFNFKNEYFPRITDFSASVKDAGVQVIGFNHGTILDNVPDSQILAQSSIMSFVDTNGNGEWDQDEPKGPFAVAGEYAIGKGTLRLVSDPNIIINVMLNSNDNYKFIQYLVAPSGEPVSIYLDMAHLPESPLDTSKKDLTMVRGFLSHPYIILGITAGFFVIITLYTYKRGQIVDRNK